MWLPRAGFVISGRIAVVVCSRGDDGGVRGRGGAVLMGVTGEGGGGGGEREEKTSLPVREQGLIWGFFHFLGGGGTGYSRTT